jgi:hypothetical protein
MSTYGGGGDKQVVPETFHLGGVAVDQFLDVPFQMGAAPLQAPAVEIHLGVDAVQDGPLVVPNQFNQRFAFAIGEDAEDRELQSSGDSQLGFPLVL